MLVRISNLPGTVTEVDIRRLCRLLTTAREVRLERSGNRDNVIAWVSVDAGCVAAHIVADRLDGRFWKDRHLEATISLFADN